MKTQYDKQQENRQLQKELLSMIISSDDLYIRLVDIIRPELFTETYNLIFESYVEVLKSGKKPDALNISRKGNIELSIVTEVCSYYSGSNIDAKSIVVELYEYHAANQFVKLGNTINNMVVAGNESEEIKSEIIKAVRKLDIGNSSHVVTMQAGLSMLYDNINNNRKTNKPTGVQTGLNIIDKHMGGLQNGDLIIIAGETSNGKTALTLSMMYNSGVEFNEPCGFISHEMTTVQTFARLGAMETKISLKHLLTGRLNDEEIYLYSEAMKKIQSAPIFVQDWIKPELESTLAAARLMKLQYNVKYIAIENAGNIDVIGNRGDEHRTATISKACKSLAKELNIPVILISHLSRGEKTNKKPPSLDRLKHSGQLENDADVVLFVYNASLYGFDNWADVGAGFPYMETQNTIKAYIEKGRNYGLAESYLDFTPHTTLVSEKKINDFSF